MHPWQANYPDSSLFTKHDLRERIDTSQGPNPAPLEGAITEHTIIGPLPCKDCSGGIPAGL